MTTDFFFSLTTGRKEEAGAAAPSLRLRLTNQTLSERLSDIPGFPPEFAAAGNVCVLLGDKEIDDPEANDQRYIVALGLVGWDLFPTKNRVFIAEGFMGKSERPAISLVRPQGSVIVDQNQYLDVSVRLMTNPSEP